MWRISHPKKLGSFFAVSPDLFTNMMGFFTHYSLRASSAEDVELIRLFLGWFELEHSATRNGSLPYIISSP
jgi:hypothetical protein